MKGQGYYTRLQYLQDKDKPTGDPGNVRLAFIPAGTGSRDNDGRPWHEEEQVDITIELRSLHRRVHQPSDNLEGFTEEMLDWIQVMCNGGRIPENPW